MAETQGDLRSKFTALGWKVAFLLVILFAYLSIGAVVFYLIEYDARQSALEEAVEELEEDRAQLLKALWAGAIAKSEDDWTLFANERMDLYETELVEHVKHENVDVKNPDESGNRWSLEGSFFYCFTIVTTIGYGNIAPATAVGKVATVVYGLIGIPVTLYLLSVIGKFLTVSLKLWIRQISSSLAPDSSEEFNFGPAIIVFLLALYFGLGAALFGYFEEWDWLDAGYFSFITFTTVGLGDLVPENLEAAILAIVFIFSALSLFSLIFNVFQQVAETYLDRLYSYCTSYKASSKGDKNGSSKSGGKVESDNAFSRIPTYQTPGFLQTRNDSSERSRNAAAKDEEEET